jgi:hypothetical protein
MSESKETAVEWLVKEVESISKFKIVSKEKTIQLYNQAINQAKEMEKQQIIKAHDAGFEEIEGGISEQYYNETYGI